MNRLIVMIVAVVFAGCGGSIDGKKGGGGDNNANNANNVSNANSENGTSGPNDEPGPVNGDANNEPEPLNNVNNEPMPNNEPEPTNNEPQPTNNDPEPPNNDPDPPNAMTTGDACANAADLEAVTDSETPYLARDCQLECVQAPAPRDCTAECVSTTIGSSLDCSYCVAELTDCGFNNCLEPCLEDPYAPDCVTCLENFCDDDFVACSGIPAR